MNNLFSVDSLITILLVIVFIWALFKAFSILLGMLIYGLIGLLIGWALSLFFEQILLELIRGIGFKNIGICKFCGIIGMIYGAIRALLS